MTFAATECQDCRQRVRDECQLFKHSGVDAGIPFFPSEERIEDWFHIVSDVFYNHIKSFTF